MTRTQLEHIIRAAGGVANTDEIVIIGSQAILGSVPDAPEELCRSMEADVFIKNKTVDEDVIEGAIGEESVFHATYRYYAHEVGPETATLPAGAWERLVRVKNENTKGVTGWCLEIGDLAVSKLCAGREKDIEFVGSMLKHKLVKPEVIRERLNSVADKEVAELASERLKRLTKEEGRRSERKNPPL